MKWKEDVDEEKMKLLHGHQQEISVKITSNTKTLKGDYVNM